MRRRAKKLSAHGVIALGGMVIAGWFGSALADNSGGLRKLIAKGVPSVTFNAGSACPGVTCAGTCNEISFTAPILLTIGQKATDSTLSGCLTVQADPSGTTANGFGTCSGASGTMTIAKPSGNTYTLAMGGQLCADAATTASDYSSFHTGYVVTGGTGPHTKAQGVGDFNMNYIQDISSGAISGTALDMGGNITP